MPGFPTRPAIILALGALVCLALPSGRAQGPPPVTRGGFVILRGTDTVAVEQFERNAETLAGDVFGPRGERFRYVARLRSDGAIVSIESSMDWSSWANSVIEFSEGTVRFTGSVRGHPHQGNFTTTGRAMPMNLLSFGLLEQLLRTTAASPGTVAVPLVLLERLDTTTWNVVRSASDSATIVFPGFGEARVALLPDGSIANGTFPLVGWSVTRTAGKPASSQAAGAPPFASFARCDEATREPITHIALPGNPLMALATPDGCWLVASLAGTELGWPGAIALFRRSAGVVSLLRVLPLEVPAYGIALTRDGSLLSVAAGDGVVFVDLHRLIMGRTDAVVGELREGGQPVRFYLNLTSDARYLFVSDEGEQTITVVDLVKARASGFAASAVIGKIPVGRRPVALTFSPDERYLYTTSQVAPASLGWAKECGREGAGPARAEPVDPRGAILVVDVERAKTHPESAVVAAAPAGCSPVRLVLSPKGDLAYVTARSSGELLAFDTRKLREDPMGALLGRVPVGVAPVGVAVVENGAKLVVANSNRFGGGASDSQRLTVIDALRIAYGAGAVLGAIPAGAFPRELQVTPEGRTLLVTNFLSRTLQLVDLSRLPLEVPRR